MNYKIKKLLKALFHIFVTKKFLIGIIVTLLLILLGSKVFAFSFEENGQTVTLPDFSYGDNFYVGHANNTYFIWSLNYDNSFFYNGSSLYTYASASSSSYGLDTSTNTWIFGETRNGGSLGARSHIVASTVPIYTNINQTDIWFQPNIQLNLTPPYIVNTETDLTGLLSSTITVDTGTYDLSDLGNNNIGFHIQQAQQGTTLWHNIYNTTLNTSSTFYNTGGVNDEYFEIPISVFKDSLIEGYMVRYILSYYLPDNDTNFPDNSSITVIYTPDLANMTDTEQIQNTIQQNSAILQQQLQQQSNIQQETQDFLKDQNFNSGNLNLPTIDTQDITQDGINNIFTMIYNAFTSGTALDIVVPIPFTDKSFTIQANYLRNILNNSQFSFVSNIIELFWWYIISVFIIKDIAKKMNKIKSGDVENLQDTNIKEDML